MTAPRQPGDSSSDGSADNDTDTNTDRDATSGYLVRRVSDGSEDRLVREEPLTIQVADHPVLTMRTPGDDLHLALGFL